MPKLILDCDILRPDHVSFKSCAQPMKEPRNEPDKESLGSYCQVQHAGHQQLDLESRNSYSSMCTKNSPDLVVKYVTSHL